MQKTLSVRDSFNKSARISIASFSHIAVWNDLNRVDFWDRKGSCNASLKFTSPTLEPALDALAGKFKRVGIDLLRLDNKSVDKSRDYRFYFQPDAIDYFEDDYYSEGSERDGVALTVGGVPFYIGEAEKTAFKKALMGDDPKSEWIEFSKDLCAEFECARGHYGFRRARVVDMFAVPREKHMAVTTPDLYRSFVPMENPEKKIDAIAGTMPHLVKLGNDPFYCAPDFYPPDRRHPANIVFKR